MNVSHVKFDYPHIRHLELWTNLPTSQLPGDHAYRFVIRDRNAIFSRRLDEGVVGLGVRVF
jgi:hypothetical protein